MYLKTLENLDFEPSAAIECDVFLYVTCAEPRSSYIFNSVVIQARESFELLIEESGEGCEIEYAFGSFKSLLLESRKHIKLVLDISCMPRTFMAYLLSMVAECQDVVVEVIALYALAEFSPPSIEPVINEAIEPIHKRFAGWSSPDTKPTSLILGLGYEPDRAEGASEYFEPSDQWIFVPKSPVSEFFDKVSHNNQDLLLETSQRRLIEYDVLNPALTYGQLEMVVGSLIDKTNPVMLPFGPKIFFFLCLVQCLNHPSLGVWHFSNKNDLFFSPDVQASDKITGVRCVFSQN